MLQVRTINAGGVFSPYDVSISENMNSCEYISVVAFEVNTKTKT